MLVAGRIPSSVSARRDEMSAVRRGVFAIAFAAALVVPAGAASAARNPSGTGQPSQECGGEGATATPPGFDTGGFAHAETQYAGSQPQNSNNPKSVSQYDVACFQVSQH
jgi:hypothetical protein